MPGNYWQLPAEVNFNENLLWIRIWADGGAMLTDLAPYTGLHAATVAKDIGTVAVIVRITWGWGCVALFILIQK